MNQTDFQYNEAAAACRDIFIKKMKDYGSSWRILRTQSVTDQIYIKANRIRSIEIKGVSKVDEDIRSEFIAIVNYGIIGLIQIELTHSTTDDYDEAWRLMRIESYTDLILMKIFRTKQIEDNLGVTLASEGIDANYFDMINYAIFGLIKIEENKQAIPSK